MKRYKFMRVALVYDRINKWGGAERVLLALHEIFPNAPVFTSVYSPEKAKWAKDIEVKQSFLHRFPHIAANHELYPYLMPIAFERFSFTEYDLVISLTSEAAKGIITTPGTKHICYCLTPTRYLWSGYGEYFKDPMLRFFSQPFVNYLRKWDKIAAKRPDTYIAISKEVQERIKKYYDRDSVVIYPPIALTDKQQQIIKQTKKKKQGYFLIVSRLSKFTKYKRIDLVIEAFNDLKLPLKIIGTGSWQSELQKMAGPTISFLGSVEDAQLSEYYQNCEALVFPGIEDFGLTIIEAQRFGRPVIAFRGGGALETVKEGKTGIFFDKQTKKSLIMALQIFMKMRFDPKESKRNVQRFSQKSFKAEILKLVHQLV